MEHELSQLKRMCADMALENRTLKVSHRKKALAPSCRREAGLFLIAEHDFSISRGCACMGLSRTAYYRLPQARLDEDVILALNELVEKHPCWGGL